MSELHRAGGTLPDDALATLAPGNVDKTMSAPATVIVAYDLLLYEKLPRLFPHAPAIFPEGHLRSNFLINLGYGDPSRLPRLGFAETCSLL